MEIVQVGAALKEVVIELAWTGCKQVTVIINFRVNEKQGCQLTFRLLVCKNSHVYGSEM